MKALRTLVDKLKPTFTRGGKLGFLASTFGAFETKVKKELSRNKSQYN